MIQRTLCKVTFARRIDSAVALIIWHDSPTFFLSMNIVPQSQDARPNGPRYKISFFEITVQLSIANHSSPKTIWPILLCIRGNLLFSYYFVEFVQNIFFNMTTSIIICRTYHKDLMNSDD